MRDGVAGRCADGRCGTRIWCRPNQAEPTGSGVETVVDRAALQALLWNDAGIERSANGLREAMRQMAGWTGAEIGVLRSKPANLLTIARVVVASALARQESRGAHFRSDFPETLPSFQHASVFARTGFGAMLMPLSADSVDRVVWHGAARGCAMGRSDLADVDSGDGDVCGPGWLRGRRAC